MTDNPKRDTAMAAALDDQLDADPLDFELGFRAAWDAATKAAREEAAALCDARAASSLTHAHVAMDSTEAASYEDAADTYESAAAAIRALNDPKGPT